MSYSDSYQEGYDAGYKAGLTGQSPDPAQSYGWLNVAYYAFKPKEDQEAFFAGWHDGYQKGLEQRNLNQTLGWSLETRLGAASDSDSD